MKFKFSINETVRVIGPGPDNSGGFTNYMSRYLDKEFKIARQFEGNWQGKYLLPSYKLFGGRGYGFREDWLDEIDNKWNLLFEL